MNVQPGIKISAAALFASFVVFAPARAAIEQTPTQDTPTVILQTPAQDTPTVIVETPAQDTPTYQTPSHADHEAQEALERAAHEAAEEQERAAKAAHEAQEELERAAAHAAHEAAEEQERAAKAAHEAEEAAAEAAHEAIEEQQRAMAKAAHEATEEQERAARAADEALEHQPAMEITVVGCVVREKEYRKAHHEGKGGPLATGWGNGNEYILVNAVRIPTRAPIPVLRGICDPAAGGEAYELTGKGESSIVKPFLGRQVELTGKLKKAKITKATRGTANPRPTGGGGPMWQDLKIFEINVYAVKDYVPPVVAMIMPSVAPPPAAVVETPQPEAPETPEPVATAGREALPKTASSLPLVGLLGAFFVAAAIGLRVVRGMTGRTDL